MLVPHDFDHAIVVLFTGCLPAEGVLKRSIRSLRGERSSPDRSLVPRFVVDFHDVPEMVPFVTVVHQKHKGGFCSEVRLCFVVA